MQKPKKSKNADKATTLQLTPELKEKMRLVRNKRGINWSYEAREFFERRCEEELPKLKLVNSHS